MAIEIDDVSDKLAAEDVWLDLLFVQGHDSPERIASCLEMELVSPVQRIAEKAVFQCQLANCVDIT